jgi:ATP-dependent helicase/nuclease subunit A
MTYAGETPKARAVASQRAASDPGISAWVTASAGTGKTRVLTERVLRLLLDGTRPEHILCLTFTKAAAAEMATRLSGNLSAWAVVEDAQLRQAIAELTGEAPDEDRLRAARRLFARVLDAPGGIKIQTIHAFCQALLKRFPVEAGVPPHFTVLEERDALDLLGEVQRALLATAMPGGGRDPAIAAALAEVTGHASEASFAELVAELTRARGKLRRLVETVGDIATLEAAIFASLDVSPEDDRTTVLTPAALEAAFDGPGLRRAATAMLEEGGVNDRRHGRRIADWLAEPDRRDEQFEVYEGAFVTKEGKRRNSLISKPALAAAPGADAVLAAEADRVAETRARLNAVTVARASAALMRLGARMLDDYAARKRMGALLDFDDLIFAARALLAERADAAWVLYKLDGGIDHILIDEAQDTNPDQWAVVKALSEEFFAGEGGRDRPRTVFAVGDVKQSIFSFQGADPDGFGEMRAYFEAKIAGAGERFRPVGLDVSFRSTRAVLQAVDAVFAGDAAQQGVAAEAETIAHIAERAEAAGLVELWPAVRPRDAAAEEPWTPPLERAPADAPRARLAGRIAETVHGWIDKGELLESAGRPIRPSDVMVLVRRRRGFVEELVRALRRLEVPVAGVDRLVLSDQIAVMDLAALARFLALPQDDLTLAALLKSPLIGLDEDQLFALAHGRGGETLWAALVRRAGEDPAFDRAHDALAQLLARADYAPPYELLARVVEATGGRAAFAARLGHEAEDAVDEFLALALDYERAHTPSLQGFLHWLEAGETVVTRDLEQGERDEVRVMTIHGSKGLQAPIVFLADTMALPPTRAPLILWPGPRGPGAPLWAPNRRLERALDQGARAAIDARRLEEYRRLLYVAMTRAEDRLYVCGWETRNKPSDACWYRLVEQGLADQGAPAAFDFGGGWAGEGRRIVSGAPEPPKPADEPPAAPAPLPGWAARDPAPEPVPPRPFAPSRPGEDEPPVRAPLGGDEGADAGARFRRGLIVHRLLQSLPALPAGKRAAAARRFLARPGHGLDEAARAALLAETMAVLEAPAHAALFAPGSAAEVPITGVVGEQVISGQVDRLCVSEAAVTILDYKTNRPPPARVADVAPLYLRQMAAYRAVLRKVYPGRPVRAALLWTDGPRLMMLPDEALDPHAP